MRFTDLFIRRPLLAWVLNALILLFGVVAFSYMELRPYPDVENAQIIINTSYPGASADVVQGFVTGPMQRAIVAAEGIDYYYSRTQDGLSTINVRVDTRFDADDVVTDIVGKIASVRGEMPENVMEPVVTKFAGGLAPVWIRMQDSEMSAEQITEFFYRVVRPALFNVEGAAGLMPIGQRPFAMRLWLDPVRMAAMDVTAAELQHAVQSNNYISEAGEIRNTMVVQPIRAATDINTASEFADIVIREKDGALVRLRDVATVELGAEPLRQKGFVNGEPSLLAGIDMAPDSNPLELSHNVREAVDTLQSQLPPTMRLEVFFDLGKFVADALEEVSMTLLEALVIVGVIALLFFGNPRAVLIMMISIPVSLVGTFLIMWSLGYSLNLFTLLALVIAIGLVVDDTIVVVENIHRYIEQGQPPMEAALVGAKEVIAPVIAMSLTLVAVFLPVGFIEGLSGQLIREFVFTLAGSVVISGVVALTLSPMLSSRILKTEEDNSIAHWLDERFDRLRQGYANKLHGALKYRPVWLMTAIVVTAAIPFLFNLSEKELVPLEDTGNLHIAYTAPAHMSEEYVTRHGDMIEELFKELPGVANTLRFELMMEDGTSMAVAEFKPWSERDFNVLDLQRPFQQKLDTLTGVRANAFILDISPAAGGANLPIQMAIRTTEDFRELSQVSERFLEEIRASGNFMFVDSDLKYTKPEIKVDINRDKAGELGISMADIGTTLSAMMGEGYINRFSYEGESYKVIPQASVDKRFDQSWLERYYVRSRSGDSIPLGAIVETEVTSKPSGRLQFEGMNAATLSMIMFPDVSMDEAIDYLNTTAERILPQGYGIDYGGKSRTHLQEGNTLLIAFILALVTIYLFLVAQYESLRDPLVVLITVPMSISGALLFLSVDIVTLSLFSQVGLITLVGLISKHGILVVDFARRLQEQGVAFEEAIIEAASIRLRPILMTTAAIVVAVLPLLMASGPGAESRHHIGLVIAAGMVIGTLFTLFVLPVMYTYIAKRRQPS